MGTPIGPANIQTTTKDALFPLAMGNLAGTGLEPAADFAALLLAESRVAGEALPALNSDPDTIAALVAPGASPPAPGGPVETPGAEVPAETASNLDLFFPPVALANLAPPVPAMASAVARNADPLTLPSPANGEIHPLDEARGNARGELAALAARLESLLRSNDPIDAGAETPLAPTPAADATVETGTPGSLAAAGMATESTRGMLGTSGGNGPSINTPFAQSARWADDFGQKLVWMARNEIHSAQLSVNPPNLGPIEISLNLGKDGLGASAVFVSPHAEVRDAIEAALPRLREMLAGAGVELGQASVGGNGHHSPNPHGDAADRQWMDQSARVSSGVASNSAEEAVIGSQIAVSGRAFQLVDTFA